MKLVFDTMNYCSQIGYNNGVPITEEDFIEKIAGKHNEDIGKALFPDWDHEKAMQFIDDKEAMFRRYICQLSIQNYYILLSQLHNIILR